MSTMGLKRETFTTSRLLDFFSEKELIAQVGHPVRDWPLVVVKELIDNALDACEESGIAPVIHVAVTDDAITVSDNGPGIPPETVRGALDFSVRVSSREAYVAPDRGAQGNALKTLIAMPFVLDGECGQITIAAKGVRHEIATTVDRVRQAPGIGHRTSEFVHSGTFAQMHWPDSASSKPSDASDEILQLALGFAVLNPHLTLTLDLFGATHHWAAVAPDWVKWKPSDPTVAHWYSDEDLWRLIAAHLAGDRGMTVRELVSTFSGLARTAKQKAVCADAGLAHAYLADVTKDNAPEMPAVTALLAAMKRHSRPVKPAALGVIGKDAIAARFAALGCEMESFKYAKATGETDETETQHDRPSVIETAFAWRPQNASRTLITGVNWSPGILNPFRQLGARGQSLDDILAQQRARDEEPVVLLLHMACPRPSYSDRGKSSVALG